MAQTRASRGRTLAVGAALLAALVLLLIWLLRSEDPARAPGAVLAAPPAREGTAPVLPQPAAPPAQAVEPLPTADLAPEPPPATAATPRPTGALLVRVRWSDRSLAEGIDVSVIDWRRPNAVELKLRGTTDARGEVRFPRVVSGSVLVGLDRCEGDNVTLAPGAEQVAEFVIPPGFRVTGRVVDAHGAGIADAIVSLSDYFNYTDWHDIARTDAEGGFVLRDAGEARYVAARAEGYAASDTYQVFEWRDGDVLDLVVRAPCGQVVGTVRGPDGAPVADAAVTLGASGWPQVGERTDRIPMGPQRMVAVTDDGGRFRFGSVPPGTTMLSVRAAGFAPFAMALPVPAGGDTPAEVVLSTGCIVVGRVTDGSGQPVPDAWVTTGDRSGTDWMAVRSDEQGRYRLEDVPAGMQTLRASVSKVGKTSAGVMCSTDEVAEWNPVLRSGTTLAGIVTGRGGEPLSGAWISLYPAHSQHQKWAFAVSEPDGSFVAINVDGEAVDVEICPVPGQLPALVLKDQPIWTGQRVFEVPWSAGAGNVVRGRVLCVPATRDTALSVIVGNLDEPGPASGGRTEADGSFEVRDLPDGTFAFRVLVNGNEALVRQVELAGGTETDLGDLIVKASRLSVHPTFVGFPALPEPGALRVTAQSVLRMTRSYTLVPEDGAWVVDAILEGDYDVTLEGPGIGAARRKVVIDGDGPQELHVDLRRGMDVTLKVCGAKVTSCEAHFSEPGVGPITFARSKRDREGCLNFDACLAPGRYAAELRAGDRILGTHEFDVSAQPQQAVTWSLP